MLGITVRQRSDDVADIDASAQHVILVAGAGLDPGHDPPLSGLLAKPEIEHVDVIEIHPDILRVVGAEFRESKRVTLIEGDALRSRMAARYPLAFCLA